MRIKKMGNPVGRGEALSFYNGGGGPDNVTSITSSEPPGFLQGPLNAAVSGANQQWDQRNFDPRNPGGPANSGPDLNRQAQELTAQNLRGDFLSPDTNPFLKGTFDRAADLTRGRLDTEFAGAGRNLGASQPARSEELQTLASNIYGGNYQQERDRQQSGIGQSQTLDPLNQFINRIAGVVPGAGGVVSSTQPVYRTGLFG